MHGIWHKFFWNFGYSFKKTCVFTGKHGKTHIQNHNFLGETFPNGVVASHPQIHKVVKLDLWRPRQSCDGMGRPAHRSVMAWAGYLHNSLQCFFGLINVDMFFLLFHWYLLVPHRIWESCDLFSICSIIHWKNLIYVESLATIQRLSFSEGHVFFAVEWCQLCCFKCIQVMHYSW